MSRFLLTALASCILLPRGFRELGILLRGHPVEALLYKEAELRHIGRPSLRSKSLPWDWTRRLRGARRPDLRQPRHIN